MAAPNLFKSQFLALLRKNFMVVIVRSWISTLIRAAVLPIAFVALLLCIPKFTEQAPSPYGQTDPAGIKPLAEAMGSKPLVLWKAPGLGPDIDHVIDTITKPLDANLVKFVDKTDDVETVCPVDFNGNSPCFAMIMFNDSPLSGRVNASWDYTVRLDPAIPVWSADIFKQDNSITGVHLPLSVAIESAMTNSTTKFQAMMYTMYSRSAEEAATYARQSYLSMCLFIINFAFYVAIAAVAHHMASVICGDRESGMSHLIDAMGGGAALARVMSNVVFFDTLYLPCWIALAGCKLLLSVS